MKIPTCIMMVAGCEVAMATEKINESQGDEDGNQNTNRIGWRTTR